MLPLTHLLGYAGVIWGFFIVVVQAIGIYKMYVKPHNPTNWFQ